MTTDRSGVHGTAALLPSPMREQALAALGLGLVIALYGNAFAVADSLTGLSLGGTLGGSLLGLFAVAVAARGGRPAFSELGVTRHGLPASLPAGLILGLLMGLPGTLYFLRSDLAPVPVQVALVAELSPETLLGVVFGRILFATALAEELAFRGLLQSRLRAVFGSRPAVLIGALFFTAWHAVVSFTTLQSTNLAADAPTAALAYLVQTLSVLVAGILFGILRERSGNLAGCVLAHWLVDAVLVTSLFLSR
jgi:membrane protease YdiL (CAAX protease family)